MHASRSASQHLLFGQQDEKQHRDPMPQQNSPPLQQMPVHVPQLSVRPHALVALPQTAPAQSGSAQHARVVVSQPQEQAITVT